MSTNTAAGKTIHNDKVKNLVITAFLLQGGKRGAVSGTLGLTIFDMLNGYMQDAPKTFVETALKCLIVGALFVMLKKKTAGDKKKEYGAAMICAVVYGCINVIMEFIMGTKSGYSLSGVSALLLISESVILIRNIS